MTKTNDPKLTTLDEILKEGAKNVSTDKLYLGITNEAYRLESEIENLSRKTEAKAKILADSLMDKNISFKEALRELNELYNRTVEVENKEIKINIIEILDVASAIIRDSMEQAECGIIKFNTKNKEIKNNNDDTAVKANEYGITVNGALKINTEQEQEMGVINYLPVTFTGANFAPEFIEQVTEEVIRKMKEAEEEANCEIEALKGEVNSLKAENDKLKEQIKNDEEIDTKFFKEVSRYFKECKGEQLEKIYDREQVVLAKMRKILKETNAERATVLLNVLIKIIPALSIIK